MTTKLGKKSNEFQAFQTEMVKALSPEDPKEM